jgi:hypothetical protein
VRARLLEIAAAPRRGPLSRGDAEGLRPLVFSQLRERHGLILGTGVIFEPGVLSDASRWLEWWSAAEDGTPVPLYPNLDPADPNAYAYERAEWFAAPRATGERAMAGPVVDYSATDQHVFTLSLPIVRDGGFLGVAAADVGVDALESIAGPGLRSLGRPAALVNAFGRVLVSNAATWMPGTLLKESATADTPRPDGVPDADPRVERLVGDEAIPLAIALGR